MRRAARTDANHETIRTALRGLQIHVEDTAAVGRGFPDLLACHGGRVVAVEVKDGSKPPSARTLTPDEQRWRAKWEAAGGRYAVVETIDQAIQLAQEMRA